MVLKSPMRCRDEMTHCCDDDVTGNVAGVLGISCEDNPHINHTSHVGHCDIRLELTR